MIQTISVQKVRASLGELINEAYYTGREFIVERKGKPMVKITRIASSTDGTQSRVVAFMKFAGCLPKKDGVRMKSIVQSARKTSARSVRV